ncbi:hypothetical protein HELRODRAFT_191107 [Helobdella robusta]|uniref:Uncharacterized protein n=1 Tax=Helobdella robusta TaxID=6412 RepID=T1FSL4_HELRO|nr:hypothetical protein HELRODRAFT_191107 [Helobdella robusta]ESO07242.1 hypothetical protein HELRODRAFT_191107 [Helobdella robusta]
MDAAGGMDFFSTRNLAKMEILEECWRRVEKHQPRSHIRRILSTNRSRSTYDVSGKVDWGENWRLHHSQQSQPQQSQLQQPQPQIYPQQRLQRQLPSHQRPHSVNEQHSQDEEQQHQIQKNDQLNRHFYEEHSLKSEQLNPPTGQKQFTRPQHQLQPHYISGVKFFKNDDDNNDNNNNNSNRDINNKNINKNISKDNNDPDVTSNSNEDACCRIFISTMNYYNFNGGIEQDKPAIKNITRKTDHINSKTTDVITAYNLKATDFKDFDKTTAEYNYINTKNKHSKNNNKTNGNNRTTDFNDTNHKINDINNKLSNYNYINANNNINNNKTDNDENIYSTTMLNRCDDHLYEQIFNSIKPRNVIQNNNNNNNTYNNNIYNSNNNHKNNNNNIYNDNSNNDNTNNRQSIKNSHLTELKCDINTGSDEKPFLNRYLSIKKLNEDPTVISNCPTPYYEVEDATFRDPRHDQDGNELYPSVEELEKIADDAFRSSFRRDKKRSSFINRHSRCVYTSDMLFMIGGHLFAFELGHYESSGILCQTL